MKRRVLLRRALILLLCGVLIYIKWFPKSRFQSFVAESLREIIPYARISESDIKKLTNSLVPDSYLNIFERWKNLVSRGKLLVADDTASLEIYQLKMDIGEIFLLSSDALARSINSKVLKFNLLYDPYKTPCYNPLANLSIYIEDSHS